MLKKETFFLATCLILTACGGNGGQQPMKKTADSLLNEARTAMVAKQYDKARDNIQQLRHRCPLALDERQAAIFTLDSVELLEARDSLVIMDSIVKIAQKNFAELQHNHVGRNVAYFQTQRQLNELKSHQDDINMKIRFFLRKLEEDRK
jgi:hypothetical protein